MTTRLLVLSDLHLGSPKDDARYEVFLKVLQKFEESSFDDLLLMGDIFDILIGPYNFWKTIHSEFFERLSNILSSGKQTYWVQGNHDFQLGKLLAPLGVNWIKEDAVIERKGVNIYVSHGDLADPKAIIHPVWRKVSTSSAAGMILDFIPEGLGEKILYPLTLKLSRASRKKSKMENYTSSPTSEIFRDFALKKASEKNAALVILGHSHNQETLKFSDKVQYLNVGSWLEEQPVGVVEINDAGIIRTEVCSAWTWLGLPSST